MPTVSILDGAVKAFKAEIAAIDDGGTLFQNVYEKGQAIDQTSLPFAVVHVEEERVTSDTTCSTLVTTPIEVHVVFAAPTDTDTTPERHREILQLVQAKVAEKGTIEAALASGVTTVLYDGMGSLLVPLDDDSPPRTLGFIARFSMRYRYATTDPTSVS